MGLKDLKLQGTALAAKYICMAIDGNEPWKVLVRNNIQCSTPKIAKKWKNLPMGDLIAGNFEVSLVGSEVFKSIWKAWNHVRQYISNKDIIDKKGSLNLGRSIWWNVLHNGKQLAYLQGCSTLKWHNQELVTFEHILEDGTLTSWETLSSKFNLPLSQARTYTILKSALAPILASPNPSSPSSLASLYWIDGSPLLLSKAKIIYSALSDSMDILDHLNCT